MVAETMLRLVDVFDLSDRVLAALASIGCHDVAALVDKAADRRITVAGLIWEASFFSIDWEHCSEQARLLIGIHETSGGCVP